MSGVPERKKRPLLRWLLGGLAALLLLLALLLVAALHSETAFRLALDAATPFIPGELRYDSASGTLAGPIELRGVDYAVGGLRIEAAALDVDLSPWALLGGRVAIDSLYARALGVTLPPPGSPAPGATAAQPRARLEALRLPVHLVAQDIELEDAALRGHDGEPLLELERLHGALEWSDARIVLNELGARGPRFDLAGHARLALAGGHEADIDLDGSWKGGAFPLAGSVRGAGDARRLAVHAALREPAQAALDATLGDLLETPHWRGRLRVDAVQPAAFRDSLPAETWSGSFAFEGDWQDTRVHGSAQGSWPPATGAALELDARVNAERVQLDALHATVDAFDATLDATGVLRRANGLSYSANGSIARFSWPGLERFALRDARFELEGDADGGAIDLRAATGGDGTFAVKGNIAYAGLHVEARASGEQLAFAFNGTRLKVPAMSATISGVPEDYRAEARASVKLNALPPAELSLDARGDTQHLVADIDEFNWIGGQARGRVALDWRDALSFEARLAANGMQLAQLDPQLAGSVGGELSAQANFAGEQPRIAVTLHSLAGELAGVQLAGSGSLQLADGRLRTQGLKLHAGEARFELDDAPGAGFDFRLDVPALAELHPELAGTLRASGHLEGRLDAPTLAATASGRDLGWRQWRAQALEADVNLVAGGTRASSLSLNAGHLQSPWADAASLALELGGDRAAHDIALALDGVGRDQAGEFGLAASGALRDGQWRGRLSALRFDHPSTGAWQLDAPGQALRLAAGGTQVARLCLDGPGGRACLGPFAETETGWKAAGALDTLPVAVVAGWLPPGLDYRGDISGRFDVDASATGVQGEAQFRLTPGSILQRAGEGSETLLGWTGGRLDVNFEGRSARGTLDIPLQDGGRINGRGTLRLPAHGEATVDAQLGARIDNLQLLPSLVPELSRLRGRLTAELRASGPLAAPRIHGRAQLHDASARVLALGTDWNNIQLTANAEGRELSLTGRAESGRGHIGIELTGRDAGDGFAGRARITGEDFKAIATPEADVDISPRLNLELRGRDLYVDGDVRVPYARIEPRDLSGAVQPSEDQVIVNAEDGAAARGLRVHAAVTTALGEDVRVDAFGLRARLDGRLTVTQQPGNPATGTGKLLVAEGQYQAYGQDLTLAKGEIIYTGQPLSNPGLDIRAERQPQPDIMVGVSVRGPLTQPVTSVYSDPPMPQTEALAWLLFGRSIAEATGEEEGRISEAAIALGLGGQKLLGNVGRRIGVEEVRVDDVSDRERASLVLGKYLSPDLYVSYGIGLFEAVNTFRIRYRLSSKWMLEATSGLNSSADFIYTIER